MRDILNNAISTTKAKLEEDLQALRDLAYDYTFSLCNFRDGTKVRMTFTIDQGKGDIRKKAYIGYIYASQGYRIREGRNNGSFMPTLKDRNGKNITLCHPDSWSEYEVDEVD